MNTHSKALVTSVFCSLALAIFSLAASATPIDQRQERQQARIVQGVSSGELTARETRALVKTERHIARTEARMKADGEFTARERARIHHKQNKASKRIYRQKHDAANRK